MSGSTRASSRITLGQATAIGVGGILGAGIFVLSGTASASAGPAVLVSFGIAFFASLVLGLCYAELSSMHDDSGGPYAYAKAHLPVSVATAVGWANWGAWICASAYVGIGFGEHFHILFPFIPAGLASTVLILIFVVVNLYGLRVSGRVQFAIMLLEIVVLVAFILFGASRVNLELYIPFATEGWSGILTAALIGFLALTGWDAIVVAAEEIDRPRRNIPAAILLSLAVVCLLYAGLLFVMNGVLTTDELRQSETPVTDVAARFLGAEGRIVVNAIIVIALTATTNAFLIVISRTSFVLGRDSRAPKVLAIVSKSGAPWVAILLAGACQVAMTLFSNLRFAVAATGVLYTVTFMASIIALFVARHRGVSAHFRVPLFPVVPILAFLLCGVFIASAGAAGLLVSVAWVSVGLIVAAFVKRIDERGRAQTRSTAEPASIVDN